MNELGKQLAENLWVIGTVGHTPVPVIVSVGLKNVPEKGFWHNDQFLRPEQWYLEWARECADCLGVGLLDA